MSHIRGRGAYFWHFDKLILHILTYKVDIEMSFLFSVCTFVYEESTFYTEDFFFLWTMWGHIACFIVQSHCNGSLISCIIEDKTKARLSTGYLRENFGLSSYRDISSTQLQQKTQKWIKNKKKSMNLSRGHNNWNFNLEFALTLHSHRNTYTDQYSILKEVRFLSLQ